MSSELFKKYYKRLKTEGILKALLCGLIIGFTVLAVLATLFWFMGWKAFWISLIAWVCISAVVTVAFYKLKLTVISLLYLLQFTCQANSKNPMPAS